MSDRSGTAFTIEAQAIKHYALMLLATPGRVSVIVIQAGQAVQSSNNQYNQLKLFLRFACIFNFGTK